MGMTVPPCLRFNAPVIRVGVALLLLAAFGVGEASACVCDRNPPCAAVWRADAVFLGTVIEAVQEPVGGRLSWTVYTVSVNQRLHGTVDTFVTLVPGQRPSAGQIEHSKALENPGWIGSSCDYRFEPGRQYIIYARRTPEGRWTTGDCTGTKPAENAAEDLDYIAGLAGADASGRIYGSIERVVGDPANPAAHRVEPAAGMTVSIAGESSSLRVATDHEGKLDARVPPGAYTVAPVVPETMRVYGSPRKLVVAARGCAPVHFSTTANGRIEGRVVRSDGGPAVHTRVGVVPADLPAGEVPDNHSVAPGTTTDAQGRFVVDAILPGRYVLAVNGLWGPRRESPYAPTYFPAGGRQDARVIELGEGERKTGFTIVVTPLGETTVSGVVLFDDERPVAGARLTAAPVERRGNIIATATADHAGKFELRLLSGVTYFIRANIKIDRGFRKAEATMLVDRPRDDVRLVVQP
jgi:hypothetical protein